MSWSSMLSLEAEYDKAREAEKKAFARYMTVYEMYHQAQKENQPAAVLSFLCGMVNQAYDVHAEALAANNAAWEAFKKSSEQPAEQQQPVKVEQPAPRKTRITKTEQLQAALDEAAKTCLPLVGAKVEYKNGQGFYIKHGKQVLGFVHNFKRGMFLVQEWQQTGRINYAELRAR